MAVIDIDGRGWIRDPENGEIVEFGTERSFEIRTQQIEETVDKLTTEYRGEKVSEIDLVRKISIGKRLIAWYQNLKAETVNT